MSLIKQLQEFFDKEEKWAKDYYAFSDNGQPVAAREKIACCWCLTGAIEKICDTNYEGRRYLTIALNNSIDELSAMGKLPNKFYVGIVQFNDNPTTTFEHIKLVLSNLKDHNQVI